MGLFTRDIKTLDDLFMHTLEDIYYAEHQILQALPQMIDKAKSPQLREAFQAHLKETRTHVERLKQVFKLHNRTPEAVTCPAIDGIIKETKQLTSDIDDAEVMDAGLVASAQAVEHYEMTRYGTLIAWAKRLGHADCARILNETLNEEKAADQKLTTIADTTVNRQAA